MKNNRIKGFLKKAFSGRMAIVSSIVALLLVGATLALMFSIGSEIINVFNPGTVDVEVWEKTSGATKTEIKLKNTGNTDAYLRAAIVTYYVDAKKNIVASVPASVDGFALTTNWVKHTDGYYYYTLPVAPTESTPSLLGSSITLDTVSQTVNGETVTYYQVVEIIPEAIQSAPAKAVGEAWRVTITEGSVSAYSAG